MGNTALEAILTKPRSAFIERLEEAWAAGHAVLPVDDRLTKPAREVLLARMRPELGTDPSIALVVPTSGTTGEPKGVAISHAALRASAFASASALDIDPSARWVCCLPLSHIAGLSTITRSIFPGTVPVICERFDAETIATCGGEIISLVPTMLNRLLDADVDMSRFQAILLGGGPIPHRLVERSLELGMNVVRTYGMTETCGGCVYEGYPLDRVEMAIDGEEILLKGPMMMSEYRLDPVATAASFENGWYRTGDIGRIDDGVLTVLGRLDDAIITGGEKVHPVEVESIIARYPGVEDVAVFGAADLEWGQAVVAAIVSDLDAVDLNLLRAFLTEALARYKAPKRLLSVEAIPRSGSGKIIRANIARYFGMEPPDGS